MKEKNWLNLLGDEMVFAEILEAMCEGIVSFYSWSDDQLSRGELTERKIEMLHSGSRIFLQLQLYTLLQSKKVFLKKGIVDRDVVETVYDSLIQRAMSDVKASRK